MRGGIYSIIHVTGYANGLTVSDIPSAGMVQVRLEECTRT